MIAYLYQLALIVKHEARMVLRSWPFRILSILCVGITCLQVFGMLGAIYSGATGFLGPIFTASNTTVIGLSQIGAMLTFTVIFFANDIGSRDRDIGISDVVASRPISRGQYVIGRLLALLLLLTILMTIVLGFSLVANYAFGFRIAPFRQYGPFFVCFSVLGVAFATTLTAALSTLIRIRLLASVAALVPLLVLSTFLTRFSYAFDISGQYIAQRYSDMIGYSSASEIFLWRASYLCLTLFFVSVAVLRYPKPEAEQRHPIAWRFFLSLLLASGGLICDQATDILDFRDRLSRGRAAMEAALSNRSASVTHYEMKVDLLPQKRGLSASITTTLRNRGETDQDTFIFVLNPGLDIEEVTIADGPPVQVSRDLSIVELLLETPLSPGEMVDLVWDYGGRIDPKDAWLVWKWSPGGSGGDNSSQEFEQGMMLGELSGWVGTRYCFLLPESHWYPVPNATYGHEYPDQRPTNFATARIEIGMPEGWKGVTQGVLRREGTAEGRAAATFETDLPVPQFSLCAGEYERVSAVVRGVDMAFYYALAHRKNVDFFADAAEEIRERIAKSMESLANVTEFDYPYASLSLVEVPSLCKRFSDTWDRRNLLVQPGVLLLTESDFFGEYFDFLYTQSEESSKKQGTGATSGQIKAELLWKYFSRGQFGSDLQLNILTNYWEFQLAPTGTTYPALGSAFTAVMAESALGRHKGKSMPNVNMDSGQNPYSRSDGFRGTGFDPNELLMPLSAITPVDQRHRFDSLLNRKTFGLLDALELVVGKEAWSEFVPELLAQRRFQSISIEDFQRGIQEYTDEDLSWVFEQFVYEPVMPGYAINHVDAYEIDIGQRERQFQISLRIENIEEGKGYVQVYIETEGLGDSEWVEQTYFFGDREEKEIRKVLRDKPKSVRVRSAGSRNIHEPTETVYVPEDRRKSAGEEFVRTISAEERKLVVIVDDLDAGFSTTNLKPETRVRLMSVRAPGEPKTYPDHYGWRPPRQWRQQRTAEAFGKYLRTRKIKSAGDGSQFATWSASLPRDGTYEVFFYARLEQWESRGRYLMTIESGKYSQNVEFVLSTAKEGWNSLGKYKFRKDRPAQVKLSDDISGSSRNARLYADAVRWVYQEPVDLAVK